MQLWLDGAYGWLMAAHLVFALVGIGDLLLGTKAFARCRPDGISRVVLGFTAGAPVFVAATLAAAFGGLGFEKALGLLALTVPFSLHTALRLYALAPGALAALRSRKWTALAVLALVAPYLVQTLLPEHNYDGPSYHRPTAVMLRVDGPWTTDFFRAQCNFPASVHLIYAWLQALAADAALLPFNFLVTGLGLLAGAALARDLFGPATAPWVLGAGATNHTLLALGVDSRIDGFLVLWVVAGVHALLLWLRGGRAHEALLAVAAAAFGMGLGTKYSAAIMALAAVPLVLLGLAARAAGPRALAVAALAALVPNAFWYVRNAAELGNPVYPFGMARVFTTLDGRQKPFGPELERLIARVGEPQVPASRAASLASRPALPKNLVDLPALLVDPDAYENELLHFTSPLVVLVLLLPLVVRTRPARQLLLYCVLAWLGTAFGPPTSRYLLPVFALAAAGAGVVLSRARAGFARKAAAALLALLLARQTVLELRLLHKDSWLEAVAGGLQWERHPTAEEWKWIDRVEPQKQLTGREDELRFLQRVGYNRGKVLPNLAAWVRAEIAAGRIERDAVVLGIGEEKQGPLPLPLWPDMSREAFRWLVELVRHDGNLGALHASLWRRGVRFVFVNTEYFAWCDKNVDWGDNERTSRRWLDFGLGQLDMFLARHAEKAHEWKKPDAVLWRLLPPAR